MGDIKQSATVSVPAAVAFDYVDNYRHVPDWMFGISKFEPVGDRAQDLKDLKDLDQGSGDDQPKA